jgi:hypothetical protein
LKDSPSQVIPPGAEETARITEKLIRQLSEALAEDDTDHRETGDKAEEIIK